MRLSAYEHTKQEIDVGYARAQQAAATVGVVATLKSLMGNMLSRGVMPNNDILAALPFVLGEKISKQQKNPYSWEEFATHPEISDFIDLEMELSSLAQGSGIAADWASATILNLWHYQCHVRAGLRVYELSSGLADKLRHTEIRGLNTDDLRLPYPSIYIVFPSTLDLKLENQVSGTHEIGGVYVTETVSVGVRSWKLLFWGPPHPGATSRFDDALFHFTVLLPPATELSDALSSTGSLTNPVTEHSRKFYDAFWRPLFQLVMNSIVYATWPNAELLPASNPKWVRLSEQLQKHPKGGNKYERVRAELKTVLPQKRTILGPSVRELGRASDDSANTGTSPSVRTLVTGHWKRQPYGPQSSLRKWTWLEPHWRGLEHETEINARRVLSGV
jgi:hypothetical protein